jgi:hypothetical protein
MLEHTLDLLALVARHSGTLMESSDTNPEGSTDISGNLMDSRNLAMCIGPTLLRDTCTSPDHERGIEEIHTITRILQSLIDFHRRLWILPSDYVADMVTILGDQFLHSSPQLLSTE